MYGHAPDSLLPAIDQPPSRSLVGWCYGMSARSVQGGPETQKALRSIGVAVLIFILTWEVATKQLQSGALDSFARSIVQSPGSLLE